MTKRVDLAEGVTLSGAERARRYRQRKKGISVPDIPRKRGYRQSPEHVEKRKRVGAEHYAWKGDRTSEKNGRKRALRLYPEIGPCMSCGELKAERHHVDGDTSNNAPGNIKPLCRRCHMAEDGRLEEARRWALAKNS